MKKLISLLIILFYCVSSFAQAWAMDEAYDDAVDSGATGFKGIISVVIFFGIVYFVCQLSDNKDKSRNKQSHKTNEYTKVGDKSNIPPNSNNNSVVSTQPIEMSSQVKERPVQKLIDTTPIETNEYTLSYNSKILVKGKDVETIHIPQTVEIIKDRSFSNLKLVKEVIIPEGVMEIGEYAFSFSSVERVVIPSTVKKVGEGVFSFCNNLKEVIINDGIAYLGPEMFFKCEGLENIKLPNNIDAISKGCFDGCNSLSKVEFPQNLKHIADDAFNECVSLRTIIIPDSVTDIGFNAFRDCHGLESIKISQNVVGLSEFTFYNDYNLRHVELPLNLTCVMSKVFGYCDSLHLRLPLSLCHIMSDSFYGCTETEIEVPSSKREWLSSILDDFRGSIHEYDCDGTYEQSAAITEKTNRFLELHNAREKIYTDDFMESMGVPTRNDDDKFLFDDLFDDGY